MYGKFEGFPGHISELLGLVSYNDLCFRLFFGCRCFLKDHFLRIIHSFKPVVVSFLWERVQVNIV